MLILYRFIYNIHIDIGTQYINKNNFVIQDNPDICYSKKTLRKTNHMYYDMFYRYHIIGTCLIDKYMNETHVLVYYK